MAAHELSQSDPDQLSDVDLDRDPLAYHGHTDGCPILEHVAFASSEHHADMLRSPTAAVLPYTVPAESRQDGRTGRE